MSEFSLVCAIEAGKLEAQTVLMLKSMRMCGGVWAKAKAVAFQGRSGAPISRETRQLLDTLDVEFVFGKQYNRAPWFNFSNKIAAMEYAQSALKTPWLIWLDSDIIFLREPLFTRTLQSTTADFIARFEYLPPAEVEGRDSFSNYWARIFEVCGVPKDDRGYVDLDFPPTRMKPFFNSGIMLWRSESRFVEAYARNFYRIVAARIAPSGVGPWFADQAAIPPSLVGLGLKWDLLALQDHLMLFSYHLQDPAFREALPRTNLVHYSKSRDAPFKAEFDQLVLGEYPQLGPLFDMAEKISAAQRIGAVFRMQRLYRRARQSLFARSCVSI